MAPAERSRARRPSWPRVGLAPAWPVRPSLGPIARAEPGIRVAVRREERSGSGTGGPTWRFVSFRKHLSA